MKITKAQSQMIMGLAVPMFMYHHMFYEPSRMRGEYVSLLGSFRPTVAIFLKMTLTLFTFISGYGAWRSLASKRRSDSFSEAGKMQRSDSFSKAGKMRRSDSFSEAGKMQCSDSFSEAGKKRRSDSFSEAGKKQHSDSFLEKDKNLRNSLLEAWSMLLQDIWYGIVHLFKLLQRYWLVFAIFIPLGLLIGDVRLQGYKLISLKTILGLDDNINAEWWYIRQFYILMASLPVIDLVTTLLDKLKILTRRRLIIFGLLFLAGVGVAAMGSQWAILGLRKQYELGSDVLALSNINMYRLQILGIGSEQLGFVPKYCIKIWSRLFFYFNQNNFCFVSVFAEGYLCARYELFDSPFLQKENRLRDILLGLLFTVGYFVLRTLWNRDITYIFSDFLFAVPFVYGVWLLSNHMPKTTEWIGRIFGKNATFIWLTHTFFIYYYFQKFFLLIPFSTVMFLEMIVVSVACSEVLGLLQEKVIDPVLGFFQEKVIDPVLGMWKKLWGKKKTIQ